MLGGALVSAAGWRWIFLINIPVGLIVIVASLRVLPADETPVAGQRARRGFDLGGGALGLAVIATVAAASTARSAAAGHALPAALTAGFHAGFAVSAALVVASVVVGAALLREDGRGQRIDLIALQTGS